MHDEHKRMVWKTFNNNGTVSSFTFGAVDQMEQKKNDEEQKELLKHRN